MDTGAPNVSSQCTKQDFDVFQSYVMSHKNGNEWGSLDPLNSNSDSDAASYSGRAAQTVQKTDTYLMRTTGPAEARHSDAPSKLLGHYDGISLPQEKSEKTFLKMSHTSHEEDRGLMGVTVGTSLGGADGPCHWIGKGGEVVDSGGQDDVECLSLKQRSSSRVTLTASRHSLTDLREVLRKEVGETLQRVFYETVPDLVRREVSDQLSVHDHGSLSSSCSKVSDQLSVHDHGSLSSSGRKVNEWALCADQPAYNDSFSSYGFTSQSSLLSTDSSRTLTESDQFVSKTVLMESLVKKYKDLVECAKYRGREELIDVGELRKMLRGQPLSVWLMFLERTGLPSVFHTQLRDEDHLFFLEVLSTAVDSGGPSEIGSVLSLLFDEPDRSTYSYMNEYLLCCLPEVARSRLKYPESTNSPHIGVGKRIIDILNCIVQKGKGGKSEVIKRITKMKVESYNVFGYKTRSFFQLLISPVKEISRNKDRSLESKENVYLRRRCYLKLVEELFGHIERTLGKQMRGNRKGKYEIQFEQHFMAAKKKLEGCVDGVDSKVSPWELTLDEGRYDVFESLYTSAVDELDANLSKFNIKK